ncbi:MAG: cysteine--tRNA ligase [Actinomycetota bacterium]|nr:cysteine--tRNA ligase [Actinomycetota bacterium]
MSLRVYNTLTGKKEELVPREEGKIGMYVCGPTVYNYIHIGNARCYVAFDVIRRYLRHKGYEVIYVQNITDIDDKIINKAREENTTAEEISRKYTRAYLEDMESLGVEPIDVQPKATEHIPEMLEMIEKLIQKGYAYVVDGDLFFEVTKFEDYGKLSHRTLEEMRAGERVEIDPRKRHPMDFALWKKAKPGEPSWPSPWGDGRPGWHIECSAMSLKYLGMGFDIHAGGQDLIFPHHENEIAQSEAYADTKPFVRHWLHNGFLSIEKEKMAKSLGNVILVREILERKYNPNALRLLFLEHHYRSPIDFTFDRLSESTEAFERLENLLGDIDDALEMCSVSSTSQIKTGEDVSRIVSETRAKFEEAMDDDFNTAAALAILFELAKDAHILLQNFKANPTVEARDLLIEIRKIFIELGEVLGLEFGLSIIQESNIKLPRIQELLKLLPEKMLNDLLDLYFELSQGPDTKETRAGLKEDFTKILNTILDVRKRARERKDWKTADNIRERLNGMGIEVRDVDTPRGYKWKFSFQRVIDIYERSR